MGAQQSADPTAIGGTVWRVLGVQPDERSRVTWAGATFFVVLAAASIGLNAADALFFLRYGVDTLPWMILFSGLAVMVATIAYAAGLAAFGARSWSWVTTVVFAVWLGVERFAIAADLPGTYPAVWLTGQVVIYVGFTLLWDVAGELADARRAKRLFPLFTSAGIAGAVTGNALTGPLASLLGTENLLIVQAAGLAIAGLLAKVTTQRFLPQRAETTASVRHDLRAGLTTTVRVPLFRLVAGVGAALSVLFFLVFFPFSEAATAAFETEEALAGFLGLFSSLATAATFLVSLLIANRLFTRLGVVAVLLIVSLVYVAGFSMWLVSFGLVTATLFRGLQWVAVNALAGTAFSSLFNVLTGESRTQVRDFVAAVPVQAGTVVAGALLILSAELSETAMTVVSLLVAAAFLLLVLGMRTAYSAALVEAVRHGLSEVFTAPMPGLQKPHHDADALAALTTGLAEASPGRRKVTAAILGNVGGRAALAALRGLLADDDAAVRVEALGGLAELGSETLAAEALGLLADPSIWVRRRAIGLLGRDHAEVPEVHAALADGDAEVRAHAARIVGGHKGRLAIDEMLADDDAGAVAAALRCVLAQPDLAPVDARRFAVHQDRRVRSLAAELLAGRRDSVSVLTAMLDDASADVRLAAAGALTKVDRSAIHDVLEHGSVRAREAALQSLVAEPERDEYLRAWAESGLDRATELYRWRMAIESRRDGASVAAEYLARILEKRERMVERWVVTALGTEQTRAAMPLVARGAISGDGEVKAEALEAIEAIADRSLARRLGALLEAPDGEAPVPRLEALQDLMSDHQYWFRALAARTIFDEMLVDVEAAAAAAGADDSPVVRTAIPPHDPLRPAPVESLSGVDAVLALQEASIFGQLDPEELEVIAELSNERRFAAGAVVYELGSPGDELMVVVAGSAIVRVPEDGDFRTIAASGPGEPLGELGVLRSRPRSAQVVAGPDGLHGLVVAGDDFLQLLEEQPEMATGMMAVLAERIARRVDRTGGTPVHS